MADKKEQMTELIVSANPHIRHSDTVPHIMADVLIALFPAFIAGVYFFGLRAASVTLVCVAGSVFGEALVQWLRKVPVTINDGSAVVMGVLLAFCCPVTLPFWMAFLGSFLAIIIAKQAFGGLGNNPFNPAHIGRAFLLASWPVAMTTWAVVSRIASPITYTLGGRGHTMDLWWNPLWNISDVNEVCSSASIDAVTGATPLAHIKALVSGGNIEQAYTFARETLFNAFIGNIGGSIGETSALALLIGALYLFKKGHISWRIPLPMILVVFFLTLGWTGSISIALFNLVAGGLMIGAFFMATDMVTTPVTGTGRIIFGAGCGLIIFCIRQFGAYPEGVCYSILLMNAATPIIDHYTLPAIFGAVKKHA